MSLVATMIERLGKDATQEIVEGWVHNLATRVFSSDALLIEAIAAGQCDVGLVNTYYLGQLQSADPQIPVALFWANQAVKWCSCQHLRSRSHTICKKSAGCPASDLSGFPRKNLKPCFQH